MKTIVCDLDGVLCEETSTFDRPLATPNKKAIEILNNLFYTGKYIVIIHTARGWAEYRITKDWLEKNHVRYNELVMGKPIATYLIDDRSFKSVEEFHKMIESTNAQN